MIKGLIMNIRGVGVRFAVSLVISFFIGVAVVFVFTAITSLALDELMK
jgi:hypothetical protein